MGIRETIFGRHEKNNIANSSTTPSATQILNAFGGELAAASTTNFDHVLREVQGGSYCFIGGRKVEEVPVVGDGPALIQSVKKAKQRGEPVRVAQVQETDTADVEAEIVTPYGDTTTRVFPVHVSSAGIVVKKGIFRNPSSKK